MPGYPGREHVRHAARRIEPAPNQKAQIRIVCTGFNTFDDILNHRVLCDHPCHTDGGSGDLIHKALLRKEGLDVSDTRFAQGPNLKLLAVSPRKSGGSQPALPILAVLPEFDISILAIVLDKEVTRDCSLHGMSDVAYVEGIAVPPSVETIQRIHIAIKEGPVRIARTFFGDPPEAVFDPKENPATELEDSTSRSLWVPSAVLREISDRHRERLRNHSPGSAQSPDPWNRDKPSSPHAHRGFQLPRSITRAPSFRSFAGCKITFASSSSPLVISTSEELR